MHKATHRRTGAVLIIQDSEIEAYKTDTLFQKTYTVERVFSEPAKEPKEAKAGKAAKAQNDTDLASEG